MEYGLTRSMLGCASKFVYVLLVRKKGGEIATFSGTLLSPAFH